MKHSYKIFNPNRLFMALFLVLLFVLPISTHKASPRLSIKFLLEETESDWNKISTLTSPPALEDPHMAYDSESDKVILFGGWGFNETWAFDVDDETWTNLGTNVPRYIAAGTVAYDEESDRIITFGGATGFEDGGVSLSTDTWVFDYNTNSWTNMEPAIHPTVAHFTGCMAYDSESDRVILFGGYNVNADLFLDDTWSYDYNNNEWTKMNPTTKPPRLGGPRMAYDSESDRVILFGGGTFELSADALYSDTWAYDYNTDTWVEMDLSIKPEAVMGHSMVYDSQSDRIILFGGETADRMVIGKTWAYDYNSNTWTDMNSITYARGTAWNAYTYTSGSDRSIYFGGKIPPTGAQLSNQTWTYNYQMNPPSAPRKLLIEMSNKKVNLTWRAPSTDTGSPVIKYRVYRGSAFNNTELLTELGSVLEYLDEDVKNGETYFYEVTAINAIGESEPSTWKSITASFPASFPGFENMSIVFSIGILVLFLRRKR